MDKNAIKKYAIWARRELIARVSQRAAMYEITAEGYGDADAVSVHGRILTLEEKNQRRALIEKLKEKGYEQVMEEVAYTWFNRFSALRFMEVNGYLPSHVRVFTDDENNFKPQIMTEAINLEMDGLDMQKIYAFKTANDDDGLFKYLIISQCNALFSILPGMFQQISDYTELLFPDNLLREGSVVEQMISMIPEEDWTDQVQIIGWLYQYYITEQNEIVYDGSWARKRISKELLPSATTIYTPDWPVHYMVENSLGRLWIEGHPESTIKNKWDFFLEEAKQEVEVENKLINIRKEYAQLKPEDIRCVDPCAGSGHILCVIFDILIQIYEDYGYTTREAAAKIVENNLWGIDIDERAVQLAYFAVMMKARQYDRSFFTRNTQPHVHSIHATNAFDSSYKQIISELHFSKEDQETLNYLLDVFKDAKEYGSILQIENRDYKGLKETWKIAGLKAAETPELLLWYSAIETEVFYLIEQAIVLNQKYHVVCTNPPYLNNSRFSPKLDAYVKDKYINEKSDLCMVMLKRALEGFSLKNGFVAFITTSSWLFLSSFEKIRTYMLSTQSLVSLVDFGTELFEGKVGHNPITAWINRNTKLNYKITAIRLVDFSYSLRNQKVIEFHNTNNYHYVFQDSFSKINGSPITYWISENLIKAFGHKKIVDYGSPRQGIATADNNRFLRLWHECNVKKIFFDCDTHEKSKQSKAKWYPYNKGGEYRKWYGNNDYVVNWYDDGKELRDFKKSVIRNPIYYFRECITWSKVSSGSIAFRYKPKGHIFDVAGTSIFADSKILFYLEGLCNSIVANSVFSAISPTLNYEVGHISSLPVIVSNENKAIVDNVVKDNIKMSEDDWNSFETSWDFRRHPFVNCGIVNKIQQAYNNWQEVAIKRFRRLKHNEEELNRIFIEIYELKNELTPDVDEKDVTVRKAELEREICSFISYAVGCMFGRYSLDQQGLILAGQAFEEKYFYSNIPVSGTSFSGVPSYVDGKRVCYLKRGDNDFVRCTFEPDEDAIIPICDDEYFNDDIVGRFVKFVEVVYGKETLEENLQFIANALGGSGTSREIIRNYFINSFYADHLKVYQKRPIYWLFDSGKKNGFKCLVYMHRYQPDTIARIRTDYVHEQQSRYRTAIADLQNRIDNAATTSERVKLSKKLKTVQEQDEELRIYEEKIHHLADQMIKIDLDDGVKVNYAKFQDVLAKIK